MITVILINISIFEIEYMFTRLDISSDLMKFCEECGSMMSKSTSATGEIIFLCRCQRIEKGNVDDTLMDEGQEGGGGGEFKHSIFIENSSVDPAANIVFKDCPKCSLNFMSMIRIGSNEMTIYSCSCGYVATHSEYMATINKSS
jgi:DNA-directed RNA polymerase subunit M/transcription elongation factor TFIIS